MSGECLDLSKMCLDVSGMCLDGAKIVSVVRVLNMVPWTWCPCLDHWLCMDQFGPCLDCVLTLLRPCMDCVWILSIQCRNVPLSCLKPVWTWFIRQSVSPPTSLGAKIHLGECIHYQWHNMFYYATSSPVMIFPRLLCFHWWFWIKMICNLSYS